MLQRNLPIEVGERWCRKYRESEALARRLVRESRVRVCKDVSRKILANYLENKIL